MGVTDWVSNSRAVIEENGIKSGVRYFLKGGYGGVWRRAGRFVNSGTPIYEKEWDVLIVLDACRADLFAEVADEYDYVESVETTTSVGSRSNEWMRENFASEFDEQISETALITGNPFSESVVDPSRFKLFDEVWKYAWDDDLGTIPPEPITDRAIDVGRELRPEKMILHYMQPHFPFIPCQEMDSGINLDNFGEVTQKDIWSVLERGKYNHREVWEAYRLNLRYILDHIQTLLENLDYGRVVITADHGNALGEFGFYGHPEGIPLKCLREVPWSSVRARDTGNYEPDTKPGCGNSDVAQKLESLGYL
jgi:hypothetical protein